VDAVVLGMMSREEVDENVALVEELDSRSRPLVRVESEPARA
jgi:hypothetical protein